MASTWGLEEQRPYAGQPGRSNRRAARRSPEMLAKLIEVEIIPRLLIAHGCDPAASGERAYLRAVADEAADAEMVPTVEPREAEAFASLALDHEAHVLLEHVDKALARGLPIETVLVEILAPAARSLGVMWENDEADFVDVTMGLWRLQELVYELSARPSRIGERPGGNRRALFSVVPGDQHSFGAIMVDECFRRRGWDSRCITNATERQLQTLSEQQWFEIIGLTASCEHHIDTLTRLIGSLREASRNPRTGILVGGQIFNNNPGLALQIGADGTAQDARQAVDFAEALVGRMAKIPAVGV